MISGTHDSLGYLFARRVCFAALIGVYAFVLSSCAKRQEPPADHPTSDTVSSIHSATGEDWPLYRGGQAQLGVAAGSLPEKLELLWTAKVGGPVKSSAVVAEGRVFIGADDGAIHAFDAGSGDPLWRYPTEAAVEAPPMLLDGLIYTGSTDGRMICLDQTKGELKWQFETGDKIIGSANWFDPPGGGARRIIFGSYDGSLYCLDARRGEKIWACATDNYINGSPAVSGEWVVVGGCDAQIHRIRIASGEEAAAFDAEAYVAASVAFDGRRAFIGNYEHRFYCADLISNATVWFYQDRNFPYLSSAAVADHMVVFGGRDRRVHGVDRETGESIWTFRTGGGVDSSPVIIGDEVLAGSSDGRLYRLRLKNGDLVWSYEIGADIIGSPAIAGGRVYIGALDGNLYAFGPRSD